MSDGYINLPVEGGSSGITSINGNSSAAQTITGVGSVSVMSAGGITTITGSTAFANQALSNLTSPTAVNQSLLFQSGFNIGDGTNDPQIGYFDSYIAVGGANARANSFPGFSGFGLGNTYTAQIGSNTYAGFGDFASVTFANTSDSNGTLIVAGNLGTFSQGIDDLSIVKQTGGVWSGLVTFQASGSLLMGAASGANLLWGTDGAGDIGTSSGVNRPNNGYFKTSLFVGNGNSTQQIQIWQGAGSVASNTIVGGESGVNLTTGAFNNVLGAGSLFSLTTGQNNNAVGFQSLLNLIDGSDNNTHGLQTGLALVHGNRNIFFGNGSGVLIEGSDNTFVGHVSGSNITNGSANVHLGRGTMGSSATASNEFVLGSNDAPITQMWLGRGPIGESNLTMQISNVDGTDTNGNDWFLLGVRELEQATVEI